MNNCTMGHIKKELSHGTTAEIVICMKVKNFNSADHKEIFNFFDDYANLFYAVKLPSVAGESKATDG